MLELEQFTVRHSIKSSVRQWNVMRGISQQGSLQSDGSMLETSFSDLGALMAGLRVFR